MQEYGRRRTAEHLCEADLPSGRGEQILAANDEIDPLAAVINRHSELIGPEPVAVAYQQVSALRPRGLLDGAEPRVGESFRARLDFHSSAAPCAGRKPSRPAST